MRNESDKVVQTIFELAAANDCNSQPPADDAADLAERTPATKLHENWAECQPHWNSGCWELEHLFKNDTSAPLHSIGQIKATLKHLNPRKTLAREHHPKLVQQDWKLTWFIDFCKAFDLVDHGLLSKKLAKMNVSNSFWLWTRSFLDSKNTRCSVIYKALPYRSPPRGYITNIV
jgi:hypothetical protein